MKQEKIAQVFKNKFSFIQRPGAQELLRWMGSNGFFSSPASTKYHGSYPGGLAEHSLNVFKRLLYINAGEEKRMMRAQYSLETLAVCGLLHDVCKINAYKEVMVPEGGKKRYEATGDFPAGHGEKSVIIILQFMKLTQEEILAIRWHMGQYDHAAKGGCYDFNNAFNQAKLAVMLHLADMMAAHFDEREETGD